MATHIFIERLMIILEHSSNYNFIEGAFMEMYPDITFEDLKEWEYMGYTVTREHLFDNVPYFRFERK